MEIPETCDEKFRGMLSKPCITEDREMLTDCVIDISGLKVEVFAHYNALFSRAQASLR